MLRQLWLRRRFVAAAMVVACVAGIAIPYRIGFPPNLTSRQSNIGIASASALVDTPKSQVADLGGSSGSDVVTLSARASLLGSLMASSPIENDIAALAGVPTNKLVATPPAIVGAAPSPASSAPVAGIRESNPPANILSVSILEGGQLPIIQVDTQAPTAAAAARLANASFAALEANVSSVAAADHVPALQRLVLRSLGPAVSESVARGTGPIYGVLGGVITFLLLCGAILWFPSVRRAWRKASKIEEFGLPVAEAPPAAQAFAPGDAFVPETREATFLSEVPATEKRADVPAFIEVPATEKRAATPFKRSLGSRA